MMDEPFTTNLCLKHLLVPLHLPLRDWAVVRLPNLTVVETLATEEAALFRARFRTETTGERHIAAPVTVDRSEGIPYTGTVEILV